MKYMIVRVSQHVDEHGLLKVGTFDIVALMANRDEALDAVRKFRLDREDFKASIMGKMIGEKILNNTQLVYAIVTVADFEFL